MTTTAASAMAGFPTPRLCQPEPGRPGQMRGPNLSASTANRALSRVAPALVGVIRMFSPPPPRWALGAHMLQLSLLHRANTP